VPGEGERGNGKDRSAGLQLQLRRLQRLEPRQRLEALTDAPNTRTLIRSLPADGLYFDLVATGLADATAVIQLASPQQFQAFVDLGAWKGDHLDHHALLDWIRAARGEDGVALQAKIAGLDLELIESVLRNTTVIHDLEEEPDLHVEGLTLDSADGRYRVEFQAESAADQSTLRTLLLDLIAADPLGLSRLLESARWELPSELEEIALRFRTARLADLGFPEPETARSLYAQVPLPPPPPEAAARVLVRERDQRDLLAVALSGLTADERSNLEDELRTVVNAVLIDARADPGDPEALRTASERARDTLQLGLEYLSGGDPVRAVEVVRAETSRKVFQVGFTLALRLKQRVDRLLRRPLVRLDTELLLWPDLAAAVVALRRPRPLRALRVEGAEPVPFRSLREIHESEVLLDRAEHQTALITALLGGSDEAARAALATLGADWPVGGVPALLLAALAHGAVDGVLRVAPLPRSRVPALAATLLDGGGDAPRIRRETRDRLAAALARLAPGHDDEAVRLVDAALERLLAQVGLALARGELPLEVSTLLPLR
jgi:hypothetical protein